MPLAIARWVALPLLCNALFAQETRAWRSMFDGKSRAGWRDSAFKDHGEVRVEGGAIFLEPGAPMTGITWEGEFPRSNYEVRFEAVRLAGNDFFASLTFPVRDSYGTFVTGGWGGDIVGISSIDSWDASDNETRTYVNFETGRWYAFRLEVTEERIRAWIDDKPVVNAPIAGRTISLRPGDINLSVPFGFASYRTRGAVRKIEWRMLNR